MVKLSEHRGYGLAKQGRRAVVHAALGEKERVFAEFAQAVDSRQPPALWLNVDPLVAELRPDPRFAALLRRMHMNP